MKKFWKNCFLLITAMFLISFTACSSSGGEDDSSINSEESSGGKTTENQTQTPKQEESLLKEFSVAALIDGEKITENTILESETAKTLSFAYSDSESGNTEGLPSVTAKWEIVSGSKYVSLSAREGKEVQITDTNYSDLVQSVSLKLTITPENKTYTVATVTINLKAAVLAKKDISAVILYNGKKVTETPTLASVADVFLSYSLDSINGKNIEVKTVWDFETGSEYVSGSDNKNSLKISNMNSSGENQEVTVKLTITPDDWAYNASSTSITFIAEDSTKDIQPGSFSASVSLNRTYDYIGSEDGLVKISWSESKNAKSYCVYRNDKQVACITGELYYLDDFSSDISEISSNNYKVTYYVKAVNLGLSSETEAINFYVGGLIPSSKANNVYAIPLKDSDGYYGVNVTWESNSYGTFEVYRLITSSTSVSADDIVKNGEVCFGNADDYKYNNSKSLYEYNFWDYTFLDEITRSTPYVHYTVVTIKKYRSPNNYVEFCSKPSKTYYANCGYLIGKPNKWTDLEENWSSSGSSSSSSGTGGSLSVSASKCIVYNRYSYCKLTFQKISGATYKIYRCARMSTNWSTPTAKDCAYIGSTTYKEYVDGGVCNEYLYENTAASGKYFWYMYYYVEATDSSGKTYVSSIVKAN